MTPPPDALQTADGSSPLPATAGIALPPPLPLPRTLFGRPIFYGWYLVAVVFVISAMSTGIQAYVLGVFLKPMTEELHWSRTSISLGQTVSTVVGGLLAIWVGPMVDRHGGRVLIVVGGVIGGIGFIALGQVHELWQYYLVRGGLITLGVAGMGGLVLNVALSNWFVRMRGRAIAIGTMGISVAALVLPSFATWLIAEWGWRTAWAVLGVMVWVVVLPGALLIRRRPEDHGLLPDGGPPPPGTRLSRVQQGGDVRWTRKQAARTRTVWMLIVSFGLGSVGLSAMLLHVIPYLTDKGFTPAQAAGSFGMIGIAGLLSKPFWGITLERVETKYCAAFDFLLFALSLVLILSIDGIAMMYLAIFVLGLGIGGTVTISEIVWANYFGRLALGSVRSIGRPFTIVTSAGGPVFAGAAYDIGGSYQLAFTIFIATYLAAALLVLLTPYPTPPEQAAMEASAPLQVSA